MKTSTLVMTLALLAQETLAVPSPSLASRQFQASIFFNGVQSNESYFMTFPTTAQPVTIRKCLLQPPSCAPNEVPILATLSATFIISGFRH